MAVGDTPYDLELKQAWEAFCDQLKDAGSIVFQEGVPATALDRASGFQYLSRYISKALNEKLEFNDPLFPQFWQLQTPTNKSFGDNPDCTYLTTWVDGDHTYRIVGNRGDVSWVSFLSQEPGYGTARFSLNDSALKTEWDGSFEIILSKERAPEHANSNWLRIYPGPTYLFVRQFFGEWDRETPMRIRIERVGAQAAPPPLTPERMIAGLKAAGDWMIEDTNRWRDFIEHYRERTNTFVGDMPGWVGNGAQTSLGRALQFCRWHIQPDEALLIHVKPPKAAYWNFELANYWFNSVDYRYRLSSLNIKQAVFEDDGSVFVVVAHYDPGIPNWLDTGGHCEGMVNQRWVEAESHPVPTAKLVKLSELDNHLPSNCKRIAQAQRAEQLRRRKIGVDLRFAV